jgi:hypothetical protein
LTEIVIFVFFDGVDELIDKLFTLHIDERLLGYRSMDVVAVACIRCVLPSPDPRIGKAD